MLDRNKSGANGSIDWNRIAEWTDDVAAGDLSRIHRVFDAHGATATELIWSPPVATLPPILDFLAGYWNGLANGNLPHRSQIDPFAMRPALGYVILLDVVDGGRDFRYRLYGSLLASISGFDMSGKLLSNFAASWYVTEFAIAVDRAVCRRRQAVYTRRQPVGAERVTAWHRICLPLVDDEGAVARLLVGTVPIDADGEVLRY